MDNFEKWKNNLSPEEAYKLLTRLSRGEVADVYSRVLDCSGCGCPLAGQCTNGGKYATGKYEGMDCYDSVVTYLNDNDEDEAMVKVHDVIQVNEKVEGWAGALMIVDEVKDWGIVASMLLPFQGETFLRLTNDQYSVIGAAALVPSHVIESEDTGS